MARKLIKDKDLTKLYRTQRLIIREVAYLGSLQRECDSVAQKIKQRHKSYYTSRLQSARFIQRHLRGHLMRRRYDPEVLERRQQETNHAIFDLSKQADFCLLQLGSGTLPAVLTLQRNIRIFLYKRKIHYLQLCYNAYLDERIEKAAVVLRTFIRSFCCYGKIRIIRFEIYKEEALTKVRRRLAVLVVKKVWRNKKLTYWRMRDKLITRKKKFLAANRKEKLRRSMTKQPKKSSLETSPRPAETQEVEEDGAVQDSHPVPDHKQTAIAEEQEEDKEDQEIERQLRLLKTAYGIKEWRERELAPILYKDIERY